MGSLLLLLLLLLFLMIFNKPGWPNKEASCQLTTFSVDIFRTVRAANHPILRDAPVHLETHVAELPPLPILITRYTQGGGIPQLLVVLVLLEL